MFKGEFREMVMICVGVMGEYGRVDSGNLYRAYITTASIRDNV